MSKRSERISLTLSDKDIKKLNRKSKQYGISRNEFINRAVFETLHRWAYSLPKKEQIKVLKNIVDKDTDLMYFKSRSKAIERLKYLQGKP
jgi:metal-responsive CopG/Arc/MetJ family transcriptional regulator